MTRPILSPRLACLLPLLVLAAAYRLLPAEEPGSAASLSPWQTRYLQRLEDFRRENEILRANFATKKTVVLLGSSSVEGFFKRPDPLPGWFTLDRGISGDRIGLEEWGILRRLDESVFDANPAHVFILNGRNDLGHTVRDGTPTVEQIAACYREVVERILDRLPDVEVHIVSCFPTRDLYQSLAPLVPQLNGRYRRIAEDLQHVDYVDVYSSLVGDDGLLQPRYSADGLHVSDVAYSIWADAMRAVLCSPGRGH